MIIIGDGIEDEVNSSTEDELNEASSKVEIANSSIDYHLASTTETIAEEIVQSDIDEDIKEETEEETPDVVSVPTVAPHEDEDVLVATKGVDHEDISDEEEKEELSTEEELIIEDFMKTNEDSTQLNNSYEDSSISYEDESAEQISKWSRINDIKERVHLVDETEEESVVLTHRRSYLLLGAFMFAVSAMSFSTVLVRPKIAEVSAPVSLMQDMDIEQESMDIEHETETLVIKPPTLDELIEDFLFFDF